MLNNLRVTNQDCHFTARDYDERVQSLFSSCSSDNNLCHKTSGELNRAPECPAANVPDSCAILTEIKNTGCSILWKNCSFLSKKYECSESDLNILVRRNDTTWKVLRE